MQYEGLSDDNSKVLFASTRLVVTGKAVYSCMFNDFTAKSASTVICSKVQGYRPYNSWLTAVVRDESVYVIGLKIEGRNSYIVVD